MYYLRRLTVSIGCVACLALVAGCGKTGSSSPAPTTTGKSSGTSGQSGSDAAKTETKEPSKTDAAATAGSGIEGPAGTIAGTVKFTGSEIPKATIVANGTDPLICGAEISKRDLEINPDSKGIRYVILTLENVTLPEGYKPPRQDLVLDNNKCQFEPHAAVITVGSKITTTNSDEVYHTTNLSGAASENIPLVNKGASQDTAVRRAGLIGVKCDKHGWMQAFIRVDLHPFHAVTDADGHFSIANVPVGTYKLKAWHEVYYDQVLEVTVTADETTTVNIEYPTKSE
jgi:plastocyanin